MLNNNSTKPSMKKETHCFYRYRIWRRKQGKYLGAGQPLGRAVGHRPPAYSLVASWFSPGSQTSEVGRLISASSFFPDTTPVSLRGSVLEKIHCEKELGLLSCHEEGNRISFQATEISPLETTGLGRLGVMVPRYAREGRASLSAPLCFLA